jgi:integrase/recombinase XerD
MASIYTRKYKNGYRVYFRVKDYRGKWLDVRTEIYLERLMRRNGKVVWPRNVLDMKRYIENEHSLHRLGIVRVVEDRTTISEAYKMFKQHSGDKREASTLKQYTEAVKKFVSVLGDKPMKDINYEDMYMFRDTMIRRVSKISTKKYLSHLNALFNWAADPEVNLIDKNPISRNVKFSVKTKERPGFTDSQIRRVFQMAMKSGDFDLKYQLEFLLLTGFRSNESCNYTFDQLDFENKVIKHYNQKRDEYYPYPMDRRLERFLRRLPREYAPYVFKYRTKYTLAHYLKRIVRKLGYDEKLSVHSLKVTYVNRLKRAGLSPTAIHILSHHKSFQTTMLYIRRDVNHLRYELEKSRGLAAYLRSGI